MTMSELPGSPDKNRPSAQWIAALRERLPCETEIDRVLTRKLQRRAGPRYAPVTLETLIEGTRSLIGRHVAGPVAIERARWLSGGASKLQLAFDLRWRPEGQAETVTPLVLRMEPSESITETSRQREFEVIRALRGHLPVPETYWVDPLGEHLPYPAIVYGLAPGVAKPSGVQSQVSGVGTFMPPALRAPLGRQFVDHLARLHTFDWQAAPLPSFDRPAPAAQALEWQLNRWERVWEEDVREDVPLMRLAMGWLRQHRPPIDRVSLVHGDYRVGNFLFTEDDQRISAWLDWELAYLGDRHEDLAWAIKPIFGHPDEQGVPLVGGFMPRAAFLEAYEAASGLSVDPKALQYYDILNNFKCVAICLATGVRAPANGKTHQDVLVAWLAGISYPLLEELRVQLEQVL